ncbi:TPA: hypothetical protein KPF99_003499 [Clostridioides difficile]|uniref:Uncharacterized protein n=1 Tax=Clostridioides difficile TaxID=1496 RepID=A0A9X8RLF3_CLODI|nr:hypothetical protein [Clostridioides difficile]EGT4929430.1 hypothetical protein [Clostridioides difficile]EQH15529.1 hypothetical protein QKW_3891 [Clostridioides difficile DA00210]MBY1331352.1 hypothetical protein [Clostridioides difficile]MBY2568625.1 hypothetical protein [Clostridioides difficile]MCW0869481.1 hypothetical protein [Clostridioides difficile]
MPVYYPFISYENKVKLLTIYPDDYHEYSSERFKYDEDGEKIVFFSEEEGIKWLVENIKADKIDPEYNIDSNNSYLWEEFMK